MRFHRGPEGENLLIGKRVSGQRVHSQTMAAHPFAPKRAQSPSLTPQSHLAPVQDAEQGSGRRSQQRRALQGGGGQRRGQGQQLHQSILAGLGARARGAWGANLDQDVLMRRKDGSRTSSLLSKQPRL